MNWLQAFIDRKFPDPDQRALVEDFVGGVCGLIFGVVMFYTLAYFGHLN